MERTIRWLRDRPYHDGQIVEERTVDAREGRTRPVAMDPRVERALADAGIDEPYAHQASAIEAARAGENVVLSTPTASGKSLAYTVPAFEAALSDHGCTLYVAPQVALIEDQYETLSGLARGLGFGTPVTVDRYTGRLSRAEKRAVRDRRPTFLLTTPDMLHYGILPHAHRLWEPFFSNLVSVVLDEIHEYRGVFGTQVSFVLRRLARVAERFGADPAFVCCSATVGNPRAHASRLANAPPDSFAVVDGDASATGPTHWLFWNPPRRSGSTGGHGRRRSSHVATMRLLCDLVARGHQTVAFTGSRQVAERYATESARELRDRGRPDLAESIAAYQAALRGDRRRAIEDGLADGGIRGVWSTSALELGVDVGGLDAVLLDGYPGTRLAAFQRAGRAGRGTDPSLVVLVAGEDQLDQYVVRHPDAFFDGEPERAVIDPGNEELLPAHVACAARENWLSPADDAHFGNRFPHTVSTLAADGTLERRDTREGPRWTYAGSGSPQHELSLRTIGTDEVQLVDASTGDSIGRLSVPDALRDAHPGAIYHHQGTTYEAVSLDLDRHLAELSPTDADYYTRVLHDKQIAVDADHESRPLAARDDVDVTFASVTMHRQITGFERRDRRTGEAYGRTALSLPRTSLSTKGLYVTVPEPVEAAMRRADGDFGGGIHAAEHGLIAMFPLTVLCDRRDVGGLSTPSHPHTGRSTIFVYDGYPGGVGLSRSGYEDIDGLLAATRRLIAACPCEAGCPACVQSPHCGNANDPLDKALALHLLSELSDH